VGGYSSSDQNKKLPAEARGAATDNEQLGFGVHKTSSGWHLHTLGENIEVSLQPFQPQLVVCPPLRKVGKGGIAVVPNSSLPPIVGEEPSTRALKDFREPIYARIIDQDEVVALREARDAEKLRKVPRQRKPRPAAPLLQPYRLHPQTQSKNRLHIKEIDCEFVSPGASSSENSWDIDPGVVPEKEPPGEELVDIEDILGPDTPTINRTKDKQVGNKSCVITRSGRIVKVVDKDNF